jgi:hypothetical protein
LTILSITFIFAISSVLLDIQRAQYLEPSPDADKTFEVWDNTVYGVEQILGVQIAIHTSAGDPSGDSSVVVTNQLVGLENYLLGRGFIASIDLTGTSQFTAPVPGPTTSASITATVSIQIQSLSGNSINQVLDFVITYEGSVTANVLTLSKIVNGHSSYLLGASISPQGGGTVSDNENGSYLLGAGDDYDIITPDGVLLTVTN